MAQEMVKLARKGDPAAFARLYEQVYQDLYRFALYLMTHRQDAEDAVSEAVIAAYENISSLRKEEAFRKWMFSILTNVCRKKLRLRSKAEQEISDELAGVEVNLEEAADVKEAFLRLTVEERTIISLTVFGGYTSRELEHMLGVKAATIRSKRSRALEKLGIMLEGKSRRCVYETEGKRADKENRGRDEECGGTEKPAAGGSGEEAFHTTQGKAET